MKSVKELTKQYDNEVNATATFEQWRVHMKKYIIGIQHDAIDACVEIAECKRTEGWRGSWHSGIGDKGDLLLRKIALELRALKEKE